MLIYQYPIVDLSRKGNKIEWLQGKANVNNYLLSNDKFLTKNASWKYDMVWIWAHMQRFTASIYIAANFYAFMLPLFMNRNHGLI